MVPQSFSINQNLPVNYHLVDFYPQQCDIGINVKHIDMSF